MISSVLLFLLSHDPMSLKFEFRSSSKIRLGSCWTTVKTTVKILFGPSILISQGSILLQVT